MINFSKEIENIMHMLNSLRVYLDGKFRRRMKGNVYFSFLNYGHYKIFLKNLIY